MRIVYSLINHFIKESPTPLDNTQLFKRLSFVRQNETNPFKEVVFIIRNFSYMFTIMYTVDFLGEVDYYKKFLSLTKVLNFKDWLDDVCSLEYNWILFHGIRIKRFRHRNKSLRNSENEFIIETVSVSFQMVTT